MSTSQPSFKLPRVVLSRSASVRRFVGAPSGNTITSNTKVARATARKLNGSGLSVSSGSRSSPLFHLFSGAAMLGAFFIATDPVSSPLSPKGKWIFGAGIGALAIATIISFFYVTATLIIWRLEYGKTLSGPFLTMLTRRDGGEDDY